VSFFSLLFLFDCLCHSLRVISFMLYNCDVHLQLRGGQLGRRARNISNFLRINIKFLALQVIASFFNCFFICLCFCGVFVISFMICKFSAA